MKNIFPQYKIPTEKDFQNGWKNALFVFDANVLLNLYRYKENTRDELLKVLDKLNSRIWIPHHAALEFQRNRLTVIAEQSNKFIDVKRIIEKAIKSLSNDLSNLQLSKRHTSIHIDPLITSIEEIISPFIKDLDSLQACHQKLTGEDPLKDRIEALFENKVGLPPNSQDEINSLYKEGEIRYQSRTPPGFSDANKDKDASDEYMHGGIIYKRKFGDFLVWHQILSYANEFNKKEIIFVTDDVKEDWWHIIQSSGPKTIGPRTELLEEAREKGKIDLLLLYKPEDFLKYTKQFLETSVSEETITEVGDVSRSAGSGEIALSSELGNNSLSENRWHYHDNATNATDQINLEEYFNICNNIRMNFDKGAVPNEFSEREESLRKMALESSNNKREFEKYFELLKKKDEINSIKTTINQQENLAKWTKALQEKTDLDLLRDKINYFLLIEKNRKL